MSRGKTRVEWLDEWLEDDEDQDGSEEDQDGSEEDEDKSFQNNVVNRDRAFLKKPAKKDELKVQLREGLRQVVFGEGCEKYECAGGGAKKNKLFLAPHLSPTSATLSQLATVVSLDLRRVVAVGIGMQNDSLRGKVPGRVVEALGNTVVHPFKTKTGIYYVISTGPTVTPGSRDTPAVQGARAAPTAQKPASRGDLAAAASSKRLPAPRPKTPAASSLRPPQAQPAATRDFRQKPRHCRDTDWRYSQSSPVTVVAGRSRRPPLGVYTSPVAS